MLILVYNDRNYGVCIMKKNMEKYILDATKGFPLYDVRNDKYKDSGNPLNFRTSPEPFKMKKKDLKKIQDIGKAICSYMDCCIELYKNNSEVRDILDRGKPEKYKNAGIPKYLFLRPDLIITENRFYIM